MARNPRLGEALTFGGRVPPAVGGLILATGLLSVGSVIAERSGLPILQLSLLAPAAIWAGQVWRLVTWPFFETDPIGLLFGLLMLFWFGRDLALAWGERRFLLAYLGLAAAAGAVTALAGLAWPEVMVLVRAPGPWPVVDGLVVAWALLFPGRQILVWFALPVSGRGLLWLTVGGTLLYSAFGGLAAYVPHLSAEAVAALAVLRPWAGRFRLPGRLRRGRGKFEVIHADRDPDERKPRWLN